MNQRSKKGKKFQPRPRNKKPKVVRKPPESYATIVSLVENHHGLIGVILKELRRVVLMVEVIFDHLVQSGVSRDDLNTEIARKEAQHETTVNDLTKEAARVADGSESEAEPKRQDPSRGGEPNILCPSSD